MFPQSFNSDNPYEEHEIGIIIPLLGDRDDDRWVDYATDRMYERFGMAYHSDGLIRSFREGEPVVLPGRMVFANVRWLSELDLTILYGIALAIQKVAKREDIAVMIDGDILIV
ncbi:MAG: hypothetical protein GX573_20895 [Chloroflexi bacterium]|nr:hypothetical protein [Chloroflexota bacterium]